MSAIRCCEMIYRQSYRHQCPKSGKIERDGKWYCGTHDPVRIKEKREERDRKWSERFRAQREDSEQRERDEAEQKRRADLFPCLLKSLSETRDCLHDIANAKENERWGWDWEAVISDANTAIESARAGA